MEMVWVVDQMNVIQCRVVENCKRTELSMVWIYFVGASHLARAEAAKGACHQALQATPGRSKATMAMARVRPTALQLWSLGHIAPTPKTCPIKVHQLKPFNLLNGMFPQRQTWNDPFRMVASSPRPLLWGHVGYFAALLLVCDAEGCPSEGSNNSSG